MLALNHFFSIEGFSQNCHWYFENEQDCEYDVSPGFACDTANGNNPNNFIFHDHLATPAICAFPHTSCGAWGFPSSDTIHFSCGSCGESRSQQCSGSSNVLSVLYIIVNTVLEPLINQKAFDYRSVKVFKEDYNQDLEDTYCCDRSWDPDQCMYNNCGSPQIEWEDNEIYLLGAYQPYYENCILIP